jgi:hypothetical protein
VKSHDRPRYVAHKTCALGPLHVRTAVKIIMTQTGNMSPIERRVCANGSRRRAAIVWDAGRTSYYKVLEEDYSILKLCMSLGRMTSRYRFRPCVIAVLLIRCRRGRAVMTKCICLLCAGNPRYPRRLQRLKGLATSITHTLIRRCSSEVSEFLS